MGWNNPIAVHVGQYGARFRQSMQRLKVGAPTPGFGPSPEDIARVLAAYRGYSDGPSLPAWAGGPLPQAQPTQAAPAPAQAAPLATQGLNAQPTPGMIAAGTASEALMSCGQLRGLSDPSANSCTTIFSGTMCV